jgi:outer membrane receptor protein involved in Fe transport
MTIAVTVRNLLLIFGASIGICAVSAAWAQTETASVSSSGSALREIVVTATRREEPLSKVPISVAAYSQDTLDRESIRTIDDISRITPGLSVTPIGGVNTAGNGQNISIRGIVATAGTPTTGIYIDDTPVQVRPVGNAPSNPIPQLFDLERVEVLRGPQGTLFGAGAEGGVIRFITPEPNLETYNRLARTELAYTEDGAPSYELGAAFGGPVIPGLLAFRVSAIDRHDGGYIDRVDPATQQLLEANSNYDDNYTVRTALRWVPIRQLDITLALLDQQQTQNGTSLLFENLSDPNDGVFRNGRRLPQPGKQDFTLPSLNIVYDFGGG